MKMHKLISLILILTFSLAQGNGLLPSETGSDIALCQGNKVIHSCRAPLKVPYIGGYVVDKSLLRPPAKEERVVIPSSVTRTDYKSLEGNPLDKSDIRRLHTDIPVLRIGNALIGRSGKKFIVTKMISNQNYGDVYVAKQSDGGPKVVIKISLSGSRNKLIRSELAFFRDIREHNNMPKFIDFGRDNEYTWFAMELVEGRKLYDWLEQNTSPMDALNVFKQLLDFLSFIHEKGYLHRDIKPEHIFVTPQNVIKVIDFGFSGKQDRHPFQEGSVVGTPSYISPEATFGIERTTAKSDIYSVAVMLYEAVAGAAFRHLLSLDDIIYHSLGHEPPDAIDVKPAWEQFPGIKGIIRKGLAKNPADRYENAAAMKADIDILIRKSQKPEPIFTGAGVSLSPETISILQRGGSQAEVEAQLQSCV